MCVNVDFPALAVINRAAGQIAADGYANHHRTGKTVVRAPAEIRKLAADLHHGRPDVIEELNLDHRLQPPHSHAKSAADDARFGNRRVETTLGTEFALQAGGGFEDAPFALHRGQMLFTAAIGDVLAEHDHVGIPAHLFGERAVDGIHHGARIAFEARLGSERRGTGIDLIGIEKLENRFRGGRVIAQNALRGLLHFEIDLARYGFESGAIEQPRANEELRKSFQGIAGGFLLALGLALVESLVVGVRMRIRPDNGGPD